MTVNAMELQYLNESDYERHRLPSDVGSFGSLNTAAGHLPLQSMEIVGEVLGLCYHLKLRQRFYNVHNQPLEATYIFPLPSRAAVGAFMMQTEERQVVGRLEERGAARRQYQQAIAQGKQAALAEEERSEVFTMTVGNIPPRQFVEISIKLDGPLIWADGQAMFRFPLVVAPRYIPGTPYNDENVGSGTHGDTDAVPDASRITPPVLLPGYPNPVRLGVDISVQCAGLQFQTPQVSIKDLVGERVAGGYHLRLRPTASRIDRDLIVRFPILSDEIQTSIMVQSFGPKEHYLMLNLVPDRANLGGAAQPRQVVALLDRSGSMGGWKMVCARRAVSRLVDSLSDQDSFQVMTFDDRVEFLDPRQQSLQPARDRQRYAASEQLSKVEARGGTEILEAIRRGVDLLKHQPQPYLVLVTDGQVGDESQVLSWIQDNAGGIRIFTVGIDKAVNASLLERIGDVTGGHFTLVESEDQLDACMAGLRGRIGAPLLSEVRIDDHYCRSFPSKVDLYDGTCARLFARLKGPAPQQLTLTGRDSTGHLWSRQVPCFQQPGQGLRKMWAREKVLELEHGFMAGWKDPKYRPEEITKVSLENQVLCRFTAFVAIDEESHVEGPLHKVTQAVSQPAGFPGGAHASYAPADDPFASAGASDPFGSACDPFSVGGGGDPFASPSSDPFASVLAEAPMIPNYDPFAPPIDPYSPQLDNDPFAPRAESDDPFAYKPAHNPIAPLPRLQAAAQPTTTNWQPAQPNSSLEEKLAAFLNSADLGHMVAALAEILEELIGSVGDPLVMLEVVRVAATILQKGENLTLGDLAGLKRRVESALRGQAPAPAPATKPGRQDSFWK